MFRKISPYFYVIPAFIIIISFRLIPIVFSFFVSFFEWNIQGPGGFVGLENYVKLLSDREFWQSMINTFWLVIFVVPLTLVLSLFFANLLNGIKKLRGLFRTIYFIPVVTSMVAISIVWKLIFNQQTGLANYLLNKIGLEGLAWLSESRGVFDLILRNVGLNLNEIFSERLVYSIFGGPSLALFCIIIVSVWKSLGYNTIIYLAGLQNIPKVYYEAADIDGANRFKKFFNITLPLVSPTTYYVLMMTTITTFQVFSQIYLMTGPPIGGPLGTTKVIVYYIFEKGYEVQDISYASAIALILFIIILTLTLLQRKFEKKVHYK